MKDNIKGIQNKTGRRDPWREIQLSNSSKDSMKEMSIIVASDLYKYQIYSLKNYLFLSLW